ncbi:glutaredoxin [Aestuariibacter sp. GS-14]|uniref:glutathione S-transferase N-terminal domain-containing protein n=1 Tax=Aestuariibacter sp. GS-14 TaxID=2590670 RepID=UPI00112CF7D7|nr:glutathione S-transferase N-terminal domain-containing protein [Aestuariibacter sp. GS-14]TPV57782.1 glutaredoxin [Aestuariibacter sp. GS-14]
MNMLIKLVRNALGLVIVSVDVLTRWSRVKRTPEAQLKANEAAKHLTLYHFFACPFCIKTRRAIYKLNVPVEKRSAVQGSPFRDTLLQGGGKVQVPCLHIRHPNGDEQWMYESGEIIAYLNKQFSVS